MPAAGWKQLIPSASLFRGEGRYPIAAYSEFMPPPRVGWKPYGGGGANPLRLAADDPFGWHVSEYEEGREIQPGLLQIASQVLGKLKRLLDNDPETGIPKLDLTDNPYWPPELAAETAKLPQERCVVLMPLALSGEVRPPADPRSTLYNTDGQIFSDAGVPVVLFMENYDINRTGYHDMNDTMKNIDLDYGAAPAAIFIETVARAASEKPWA
jgi:hypothetical protein